MHTRRNLLRFAASAPLLAITASLLRSTAVAAVLEGKWHVIHSLRPHSVAASRSEAIAKYLKLIDQMQYSPDALAYFHRVIPTEQGQLHVPITNQQYAFMAFAKDGVRGVEPRVWLRSQTPEFAERWTYAPTGEAVDLPETCENFAKPYFHCFCYHIESHGYPQQTDLPALISPLELEFMFYYDDGSARDRLKNDSCFYAEDSDGTRVPIIDDCNCDGKQQAVWPADVPQQTKTLYKFVVTFPSGSGRVHVPRWFEASSLWCFDTVTPYTGPQPTWDTVNVYGWTYYSYYDTVAKAEVAPDMRSGADCFHRTIVPRGIFGKWTQ